MDHKATDIEKAKRLIEVETMLLEGFSYTSIVRYGAEKWSIGSRQIDKYIAEIKETWLKTYEKKREQNLAKAIRRREHNYAKNLRKGGNPKLAYLYEKDKCKLQGLYVDKVEVTGKDGEPVQTVIFNSKMTKEEAMKMYLDAIKNNE